MKRDSSSSIIALVLEEALSAEHVALIDVTLPDDVRLVVLRPVPARTARSRLAQLQDLLLGLFSEGELRGLAARLDPSENLAHHLPGGAASLHEVAAKLIELVKHRGLFRALFAALRRERPRKRSAILNVKRLFDEGR